MGDPEIGTRPKLKCVFYRQNLISNNQPQFSRSQEGKAKASRFRAGAHKERPCFWDCKRILEVPGKVLGPQNKVLEHL